MTLPPLILVHILHPDVNWGEFAAKIVLSIGAKPTSPPSYHNLRSSRNLKRHHWWWDTLKWNRINDSEQNVHEIWMNSCISTSTVDWDFRIDTLLIGNGLRNERRSRYTEPLLAII